MRRKTRKVRVGRVAIGGDSPVSVQGMTKVRTAHTGNLLREARRMVACGAEIVRVAVLDEEDAEGLKVLKGRISVPVVADIHYSRKLALLAMEKGADKIRLNPGNLSLRDMRETVMAAKDYGIPVRLGVNSGSVEIKGTLVDSMVNSAMDAVKLLQDMDFHSIVLSLKTPSVQDTVACYRRVSELCDYPLHLGVTEAGRGILAESKSILGTGILLFEGIGDTIRVSLTEPSCREIETGRAILQSLGLRNFGPEIISCPTCGRSEVDVNAVLRKVEEEMKKLARRYPAAIRLKVAVMGCSVNGPGEARQADTGIAGGKKKFALFKKGSIIGSYNENVIVRQLIRATEDILKNQG